ncbi:MAG: radical SAM protein [Planctomycetes bacterium]|nr:radical SAM protein [Planctomycetota bacterium]
MKILLVKPRWFVHGGQYRFLENIRFPALSLGILAALSDGHDVTVIDGDWDPIPFDRRFDLVGITTTTFTSQRVYRIAAEFKRRGARVVLGGVHPSILPSECLEHVDSVVVGEAEYVWKDLLADAEKNSLKPTYAASRPTDMNDVPFPRRDLLGELSWFTCLQATRGCPNTCRYCYLPSTPWSAFRKRSVELVAEEIRSMPQNLLFFVDDNLFADRDYALSLFKAVAPLKKNWSIQAPTTIGDDIELLDAAADAGCFNMQIGFQSFNKKSLEWASVGHNRVEKYKTLVSRLHDRKILATAFFMFGFDSDGPDIFDTTVEMARMIDIDDANCYILTPYPGTELYARFMKEDRLLPGAERSRFGWAHAVFRPQNMSPEELEKGVQSAYDRLYAGTRRKLPRTFLRSLGLFLRNPRLAAVLFRGASRRAHVADLPPDDY